MHFLNYASRLTDQYDGHAIDDGLLYRLRPQAGVDKLGSAQVLDEKRTGPWSPAIRFTVP